MSNTKTKHTPGPWEVIVHTKGTVIHAKYGLSICELVNGLNTNMGEAVPANARLIAAAPEMLEALRLAQAALIELIESKDRTDLTVNAFNESLKAIAKATGGAK